MFALIPLSNRLFDDPIVECRASEEYAHEVGESYAPSKAAVSRAGGAAGARPYRANDTTASAFPTPHLSIQTRPPTAGSSSTTASTSVSTPVATPTGNPANISASRAAAEASLCRNSLFPNVVKQQSRCLSVLLQHGPHGGIRRIGPLLITKERGGPAIALLNPAFIDMMDVQPVDSETTAFLKRSNIRRRSFSMPPTDPSSDWLSAISGAAGAKRAGALGSSGPGMWWPLNDDNCSNEVAYDVHVTAMDALDGHPAGARDRGPPGQLGALERMGSASTLVSSNIRPATAPRKGSVSSQLRMMVRAESSNSVGAGGAENGTSLGGHPADRPSLTHMSSDASEASASSGYTGRQTATQPAAGAQQLAPSHQLADVTMKTESGTITRSLKSISLRLLVNRLASPEGNVDSDLLTDFLNSYRFFAHPIDVMRLIVIRYLNCFAASTEVDSADGSDAEDDEDEDEDDKYLTINGWRSAAPGDECAGGAGDSRRYKAGDEPKAPLPSLSSRSLPPLARNDSAIVQLRVMNIIKYWIKFHPHDFRLHHRLTRLLLLFLSHIQKQPGRAEFVNSIRQKLSSGKLLAVETPSFAGPATAASTAGTTAVPSQASSVRSSGLRVPTLESARSAIDLRSADGPHLPSAGDSGAAGLEARARAPWLPSVPGTLVTSVSAGSLQVYHARGSAPRHQQSEVGAAASGGGARMQHSKKGSTSYFRSLFQHRSNRGSSGKDASVSSSSDMRGGHGVQSGRASLRGESGDAVACSELPLVGTSSSDQGASIPTGDMYASDFGSLVMEALAKSGVPTPQTPIGRTLLNYSIANRNPYRINLVCVDPATFAEQLTLLEHELFSRISATEFSLKGRVGNLETILQTMQGAVPDARSAAPQTAGGQHHVPGPGQGGSSNPVPNLTAMTSWFNQATYWAVLAILSEPTPAARALAIKQLIHIAFHCLARRNYYGSFELAIALDNSAVRRLHESWQLVPPLMKDIVAHMLQVLQSRMNFRTYRESVKAAMAGASGPDEDIFGAVNEKIRALRAKDMIATTPGAPQPGLGSLVHGALFGAGAGSDESKHHSRKKSSAHGGAPYARDGSPLLSEQDCACIIYAIRIRAASFTFVDPSADPAAAFPGGSSHGHSSVPVSSSTKSARGSGTNLSVSGGRQGNSGVAGPASGAGSSELGDSRSRRARSTSSSGGSGSAGGRVGGSGGGPKQGRMITDGVPLPLVPFVAVHMTDLLHADEANSTYSEEHQKMHSRNQTGPDPGAAATSNQRMPRCDSAAISNVNQAQPRLNMQKFRLVTAMFRELHLAQRTKYPYVADKVLQQQIHCAVRNIKAQANDIYAVVEDVVLEDPVLARPPTAYASSHGRSRTGSSASRQAGGEADTDDSASFGYPLYQIAAMQRSQDGQPLLGASMEWDCTDIKDNQELEQRLYMLSKWVEPSTAK
ncbi:hypothetical protein LPJ61_001538 [Coemansia biformis]|uniref:Ras GEF n=1 Tax=Coemansia biformis TaxID=1286918 RepID=A0A9W7YGP9_9FUNG|nr:hypothetical protein LPJ61_001538 [Coemansia biformis]